MRRLDLSNDDLAALVAAVVERGLRLRLRAKGSSMGRSLPDGSRPSLVRADAGDVRPGEVVLCRVGPRLLLHRARVVGSRGIWVQGDALALPDGFVAWPEVLAKVAGPVPRRRAWGRLARLAWRLACGG